MDTAQNPTDALMRFFSSHRPAGVISAYLFGSHTGGRAHRESDVDIGILLDRHRHPTGRLRFEYGLILSGELIRGLHGEPVDVVILNDAPPPLGARIVTTGARVYCSDPEADRAFLRDVQLRNADLAPFLERTRRIKLSAIQR